MDQATKIATAEAIIRYTFVDKSLLWEALQMAGSGVTYAGNRTVPDGNKHLAVGGDTVAQTVLWQQWYRTGERKGCSPNDYYAAYLRY